ncbi:hypothetical protein D0T84_19010 [Dysgonomonas sp. 521]|uniref:DUF748 domain-containing protein n=1 Tax=Dysgonomonas sp. 521 TaxID=2302932 RepID=UPI0013D18141|nr:DUF748 domain-containing protein [Dysgonomonas sp. 521]NDV96980.1 hypothetical protein [Dysgonomonas sp. 521]
MAKNRKKIIKTSLLVLALLIVGGFLINWYMTYRLEDKLNKKLSEAVSDATDGFYHFSFESLSIGLFSGELSIRGIKFTPDSLVFNRWEKTDSLPNVYYDINIGEIHFKGINLTWRRNYKKLEFSLFEVKAPDLKIFEPTYSTDTLNRKHVDGELKSLYQVVAPYIDLLTVDKINLTDANVSYTVVDSISPVIYSLQEANFHAYNFRLDENSTLSGKLLYCDNFEFSASKPQSLLYSDQIILNTQNIKLSTIDSVIQIEGVNIHPKDKFWEGRLEKAGGYLNARIDEVLVQGAGFERKQGLNHLHARTFDITSTSIEYYSVKGDTIGIKQDDAADQTWSLYSIISPILYSISIDKIGIEKTKFNYTYTQGEYTDIYTLGQFDFHANNFLVNPLSERQKKFWYVDNFALVGEDISGLQRSNNANINVKRLYLNTSTQDFSISDIRISPISTNTKKDYLSGSIRLIDVGGLDYSTGVSAGEIIVDSANVEYFKLTKKPQDTSADKSPATTEDALDFFTPYSDFLLVKAIKLTNANLVYHDKRAGETYRLNNLNFSASDFFINKETRNTSPYLFTYRDIAFSIRNFDNYLPGKYYRLQVSNADVSTRSGKMILEGVRLIPQDKTWKQAPSTYYEINTPLIRATGFNNDTYDKKKILAVSDFVIKSPQIRVIKTKDAQAKAKDSAPSGITSLLTGLVAENVSLDDAKVIYLDRTTNDSLQTSLSNLQLRSLKWDLLHNFRIGEFILRSPHVYYAEKGGDRKGNEKGKDKLDLKFLGENVNIGKFIVSNASLDLERPADTLGFRMKQFDFSGFNWKIQDNASSLGLATINIEQPVLNMKGNDVEAEVADSLKVPVSPKDFYSLIEPYFHSLSVREFNLSDANINYSHSLNEEVKKHQVVNQTNLAIRNFRLDTDKRKFDMSDIRFDTKDLAFPIMDGFYTLGIGNIKIDQKQKIAEMSDITMKSAYPKFEFAYKHPKHKDWFDVSIGDITLSGLDFPAYFSDNMLKAAKLAVKDVNLQNLKNQQIEVSHNIMPLIYEKIQQLPLKLDIDTADVRNFSVLYEELPRNGTVTGKIRFDKMNGKLTGLTNIVLYPNQFIKLDADGRFMNGYFTAQWNIPVNPDYDCFTLSANIKDFDLMNLNGIFLPLAKAEIQSGMLRDFRFSAEASSTGATADMLFLYNDLKVSVLKDIETEQQNKFLSRLANIIVRSNNPNKPNSKPREAHVSIGRDPYHSTFNYFWQILQPAIVESAGVSQKKQNFVKKATGFFVKVKNFFTGKKKDKNKEQSNK